MKANATASLVFAPGGLASTWVCRGTMANQPRARIVYLVAISLIGSGVGSGLLLSTLNRAFSGLVPWLLLIAALFFTLAPGLRAAAAKSAGQAQGQISVPAIIRQKLGIEPGSVLEWKEDGDRIVVRRVGRFSSQEIHQALFGVKPRKRHSLKELREGIAKEMRKRHARPR